MIWISLILHVSQNVYASLAFPHLRMFVALLIPFFGSWQNVLVSSLYTTEELTLSTTCAETLTNPIKSLRPTLTNEDKEISEFQEELVILAA